MITGRTKILIITRSFVKEVSAFVKYANRAALPFQFFLVMPHCSEPLPATISIRRLYGSQRIRTACYAPSLIADIRAFRPDIIHIFEEYSGIIAFQSIVFSKLLFHKSKVMVYSAENILGNVRPILRFPMRYVMRHSDMAFVCSRSVKTVLEKEDYQKPVEVFPLGVDTAKFYKFPADELRRRLQLRGKFVIGYIGRLLEMKGVSLLVEMMQYLPDTVHLLMVGSGPEENSLRKAAVQYNLSRRIHLVGDIVYDKLPQYINCMDIGIVPSFTTPRWKEQFGRVIIEFMSCEVAVIGSDSGSIPELLEQVGLIFHERNFEELVDAVKHLMEAPEERKKRGRIGRQKVESLYSLEVMSERLVSMYQQLNR